MVTHACPRLYSTGPGGPRHLHKIDGQTSRRPVIDINIKDLVLYRYFKCTRAQPHPRLLTFVDDSFFLPATLCVRFQVAVRYLLTTATAGFPLELFIFPGLRLLHHPAVSGQAKSTGFGGWGIQPGGAVASVTPNPSPGSRHPSRSFQVREEHQKCDQWAQSRPRRAPIRAWQVRAGCCKQLTCDVDGERGKHSHLPGGQGSLSRQNL